MSETPSTPVRNNNARDTGPPPAPKKVRQRQGEPISNRFTGASVDENSLGDTKRRCLREELSGDQTSQQIASTSTQATEIDKSPLCRPLSPKKALRPVVNNILKIDEEDSKRSSLRLSQRYVPRRRDLFDSKIVPSDDKDMTNGGFPIGMKSPVTIVETMTARPSGLHMQLTNKPEQEKPTTSEPAQATGIPLSIPPTVRKNLFGTSHPASDIRMPPAITAPVTVQAPVQAPAQTQVDVPFFTPVRAPLITPSFGMNRPTRSLATVPTYKGLFAPKPSFVVLGDQQPTVPEPQPQPQRPVTCFRPQGLFFRYNNFQPTAGLGQSSTSSSPFTVMEEPMDTTDPVEPMDLSDESLFVDDCMEVDEDHNMMEVDMPIYTNHY